MEMAHSATHRDGGPGARRADLLAGGTGPRTRSHMETPTSTNTPDDRPAEDTSPPVWNTAKVASVLDVSPSTVKRWVGTPGFPRPRQHRKSLFWLPEDILRWAGEPEHRRRTGRGPSRG